MPVSRRLPPILLLPLALAAAGCLSPTVTDEPLVLGAAGPVSVDVDSFRGDVTITVDPDAAGATVRVIRAASHGAQRGGEARASLGEIAWDARIVPGDLGPVIEVHASTIHPEPHFQRADVFITAPDVDGVRIRTRDGDVTATDIRGEVDIVTTYGNVRLMTTRPMTRAVSITSTEGDIDFRVRAESAGLLDCDAIGGNVTHRCRFGEIIVQAGTDHDTLLADFNGGENLIRLRTVDGDIRIAVVSDPLAVGQIIVEP
ncbi:MAG: DUF4097 family beta strand repeat-containing protein [Planctomycetota bacterium]|jgi:hypothetical protein